MRDAITRLLDEREESLGHANRRVAVEPLVMNADDSLSVLGRRFGQHNVDLMTLTHG
jgi:hypothetical protein